MATKYARAIGGNWSTNATWSTSTGGAADTTAPTNADDAIIDGASGAVTVDTTTCVCKTLVMTNAVTSLTVTAAKIITISGSLTLPTGAYNVLGTGRITLNASGTLTSNSKTIAGDFYFGGASATYVLLGNASVSGLLVLGGGVSLGALNWTTNESITANGGVLVNATAAGGTASLITTGGNLYSVNNGAVLKLNTTLAGNQTIGSATYDGLTYNTGTFTYSSGTISYYSANTSVYFSAASTINTGVGMAAIPELRLLGQQTLNADLYATLTTITGTSGFIGTGILNTVNLTLANTAAATFTTLNAFTVSGTLTVNNTTALTITTSVSNKTITCNGDITYTGQGGTVIPTVAANTIVDFLFAPLITTTKTWSCDPPTSLTIPTHIKNNITVNGAGTLALGTHAAFSGGILTCTTVPTVVNSTLWIYGDCTLSTTGTTWNRLNCNPITTTGISITLTSALATTTLNFFDFKTTFIGAYNITTANIMMFPHGNGNVEAVLVAGQTLNITGKMECYGTTNYLPKITSSAASNANINYTGGRQQNIIACSFTWINATGQTLWYVLGTQSNTTNINQLSNTSLSPLTTASGF